MYIYGVDKTSEVGKLIVQLEEAASRKGLTLSRWRTNSRTRGYVKQITWAVHRGKRAAQLRFQEDLVAYVILSCREGNTQRSQAFKLLTRLLREIEKS